MSTGYIDWSVPINISAQELSEIMNRPKYGAAQDAVSQKTGIAVGNTAIATVAGQGMIYGGFVSMEGTLSHKTDLIRVTIDGDLLTYINFEYWNTLNLIQQHCSIANLLKYDDANFIYVFSFNYGYTFEESFLLEYDNNNADAGSYVQSYILYALV